MKLNRSPIQGFEYEAPINISQEHLELLKTGSSIFKKKRSASPMKLKPSASTNCLRSDSVKSLGTKK